MQIQAEWVAVALTVLTQIGAVAFLGGILRAKVESVQRELNEHKALSVGRAHSKGP